jgi:cell division protein ZapA
MINGYSYLVGCEDGQEAHLMAMAEQVEQRIDNIQALGNQSGEARLLVLAALLMADELHDLQLDLAKSKRGPTPRVEASRVDAALAKTLGRLADRAEEIAVTLERT